MGASMGRSVAASEREAGLGCPHCGTEVGLGEAVVVCRSCGTVHHEPCWEAHDGCGSYQCAPACRAVLKSDEVGPVLRITANEIDRAIPLAASGLPHRMARNGPPPCPAESRRVPMSRLAIASLVCGIAGIPLFGLLTGVVAVLLGVLALGAIQSGARRGLGLAVPGLLLGVVDVGLWAILLSTISLPAMVSEPMMGGPPDIDSIRELDAPLQRAMRANVLIERREGMALLGGRAIGSGVILRIDRGEALIVTNRHVVDSKFPSANDGTPGQLTRLDPMTVRILGQPETTGHVVWMAPGEIDLALIRCPAPASTFAQSAPWAVGRAMRVGDRVFAIGNPHHLGWTHTQGVISQFRSRDYDGRRVRVIQTQAAINPGNSGGGLYDEQGYCLGINTWTADKSISEGIGFAIALDTLDELAPTPLREAGSGVSPKGAASP